MNRSLVLATALLIATLIAIFVFVVPSGSNARTRPIEAGSSAVNQTGATLEGAHDEGPAVELEAHGAALVSRTAGTAHGLAIARHIFAPPTRRDTEVLVVELHDRNGRGVPNASVEAHDEPWAGFDLPWEERDDRLRLLASARTDAQGHARLAVLTDASIDLRIEADGAPIEWKDIGTERSIRRAVTPGVRVELQVLDVHGARITTPTFVQVVRVFFTRSVQSSAFEQTLWSGTTDASGRIAYFDSSSRASGYRVGNLLQGFFTGGASLNGPDEAALTLRVQQDKWIQASIVEARTGSPPRKALIHLLGARETAVEIDGSVTVLLYLPRGIWASLGDDGDWGSRHVGSGSALEKDDQRIVVRASGHAPAVAARNTAQADPGAVRVSLVEAAVARGRILAGGRPAGGVHVALISATSSERSFDLPLRLAETRADGSFEFDDLDPRAKYRWIANGEERGRALGQVQPLGEACAIDLGDIELAPESSVSVTVENELGERLHGIKVGIYFAPHGSDRRSKSAFGLKIENSSLTSEQGEVLFQGLIAGEYEIAASTQNQDREFSPIAATMRVDVRDNGTIQAVKLVLPDALAIEGRVVDWTGRDVPRPSVALLDAKHTRWGRSVCTLNPDGTFRLFPLLAGQHVLEVRAPVGARIDGLEPGVLRTAPITAGTKDALLQLQPVIEIEGVVLDPRGMPVPQACVWAERANEPNLDTTFTDAFGRFKLQPRGDAPVELFACWTTLRAGSATQRVSVDREFARMLVSGVFPGTRGVELRLTTSPPPPPVAPASIDAPTREHAAFPK